MAASLLNAPLTYPSSTMADDRKKTPGEQRGEGFMDEAKGRVKQAGGAITGDDKTKREGQADQWKGEAKQKIADVRDKVRDKI
jgi:uncharacterized protein YjbJ (UPF0337 family)